MSTMLTTNFSRLSSLLSCGNKDLDVKVRVKEEPFSPLQIVVKASSLSDLAQWHFAWKRTHTKGFVYWEDLNNLTICLGYSFEFNLADYERIFYS